MSRLKRLLVEAHQRSVLQALAIYTGASFAVLERVDRRTRRPQFGVRS
ncbi:MAG: hypothetical protein GTO46_05030 [Gemmatimonadetes bacterium]|nr:hypothetical protein [Gemmatimonadota bacterium]NIO30850.1 hypothetical protein [Gemmatimonadota bacterium]